MSKPTKPEVDLSLSHGDVDQNPSGIGLRALLAEDFATYKRDPLSPGFWAVAIHRLGNARMSVRSKLLRAPMTLAYRAAFHSVVAMWGIDLPYNVKLGRRVRIEHHGCLMLGARQIGDDVVIRHSVTMGLRQRGAAQFPTIGDRVEIGPGACIVGGVKIGDGSYIGANSVICHNVRPGSTVMGIPPLPVDLDRLEAAAKLGSAEAPAAGRDIVAA